MLLRTLQLIITTQAFSPNSQHYFHSMILHDNPLAKRIQPRGSAAYILTATTPHLCANTKNVLQGELNAAGTFCTAYNHGVVNNGRANYLHGARSRIGVVGGGRRPGEMLRGVSPDSLGTEGASGRMCLWISPQFPPRRRAATLSRDSGQKTRVSAGGRQNGGCESNFSRCRRRCR